MRKSVELLESNVQLDPNGDVILRQLIQTGKQKPQWFEQNVSAVARTPDPTEEGSMNSGDAFLLGVAMALGTPTPELQQRLKAGEQISLYQRPQCFGQGAS